MGINVRVVDRADNLVDRTGVAVNDLRDFARDHGLPVLAHVGEYEDTRFTRMQMALVEPEVETLAATGPPDVAAQARELLRLIAVVKREPGRYLFFIGD